MTARSGLPSPLRSPIATDTGLAPTGTLMAEPKMAEPKPLLPLLSSTDTVPENWFATARSGLPSPLRSPIATDTGPESTGIWGVRMKPPLPLPSSTDTVPEVWLATTRSGLPSPLRSPIATDTGRRPTGKSVAGPKPPLPLLSSTDTVLEMMLATTRSGLPSPLRSPSATDTGGVPSEKLAAAAKLNASELPLTWPAESMNRLAWSKCRGLATKRGLMCTVVSGRSSSMCGIRTAGNVKVEVLGFHRGCPIWSTISVGIWCPRSLNDSTAFGLASAKYRLKRLTKSTFATTNARRTGRSVKRVR